jgi:DNA-binding PadR family transcriptional regulator
MHRHHDHHREHDHRHEHEDHCGRRFARGEFGGWGRHGGRHMRGGGWRGRFFDHGDLRLLILQLIAEKPRHGYELIKDIEERLAGAYSPSPGVVYPTLTMLEELGHATVDQSEGSNKKLYAITEEGRAHLAANQDTVNAILARMAEAGAAQGGGPAPQILRAMENLRMALRLRMARGPLSEEQVRRIAAVLDEAASKAEGV